MKKKNLKPFTKTVLSLMVFGCLLAALGYYALLGQAIDTKLDVRVDAGTTCDDVIGKIRPSLKTDVHRYAFDAYAKLMGFEGQCEVGNFSFAPGTSVFRIVRRVALGKQTPVRLVIGTARTLPHLATKISKQIYADTTALLAAMRNEELRKELGFENDSTIALFIPNTYEVYWDVSPEDLLRRMYKENNRFWNEKRTAKLKRCGLTKYEVMTLASIVYEETKAKDEMKTVAGVYINRLRARMRLQADPTVKYAMGDFSLKRLMHKHLKFDSPFNTYTNAGLPPAPICIPSIAAIDAVLDYEEHDYLYFCARPEFDGRHNFARNLDEHNVNARKYAEALNKQGINSAE